jgi:hypothetical protein
LPRIKLFLEGEDSRQWVTALFGRSQRFDQVADARPEEKPAVPAEQCISSSFMKNGIPQKLHPRTCLIYNPGCAFQVFLELAKIGFCGQMLE